MKIIKNTPIILFFIFCYGYKAYSQQFPQLPQLSIGSNFSGSISELEEKLKGSNFLLPPEIQNIIRNMDKDLKSIVKVTIELNGTNYGLTDFSVDADKFVKLRTYEDLLNLYMEGKNYNQTVKDNIISFIKDNSQLNGLYRDTVGSFNPLQFFQIVNNPTNILNYTTNASAILFVGTSLLYMELVNGNYQITDKVINKLKSKFANISTMGDNYGLIIPLHFPLGTLGINIYSDFSGDINKLRKSAQKVREGDYDVILDAIDFTPLPYIQLVGQINTWNIPFSLGFRLGGLFGFEELYKMFISDIDIQALGFHLGMEFKYLIYRNNHFFTDLRLDANYDMGSLDMGFNNTFYLPISAGGVDTGLVLNGDFRTKTRWNTLSLTPKITLGYKPKEKVPYIWYFGLYFHFGADLSYGNISYKGDITIPYIYANIYRSDKIVRDLNSPTASVKGDYFYYDFKIGATMDIFFQSISFEYYIRSKRFSVNFIPFVFRF